ncbi:MAG: hypothetical protein WC391_07660 [Methanoregula sp.]|jgi:hypothetical protein
MDNEFCTRTARKLRKLGYVPKVATFFSRFFYLSMLSVSGIVLISMRYRNGVIFIGDEIPRLLRYTLAGPIASISRTTGAEIIIADPAAVYIVYSSSRIHRN